MNCDHEGELRAFCELQKLEDGSWAALPFVVGGKPIPLMIFLHDEPAVALEAAAHEVACIARENDEILEDSTW